MKNIKNTLAHLDSDLLAELLDAAQFALNDSRTVKRVAAELGVPAARVKALAYIAVQLSMEPDAVPEVSTMAELDALSAELAGV